MSEGCSKTMPGRYKSRESDRDRCMHTKVGVFSNKPGGMTKAETLKIEKRLQEKISEGASKTHHIISGLRYPDIDILIQAKLAEGGSMTLKERY